jgi:hypothetical protein
MGAGCLADRRLVGWDLGGEGARVLPGRIASWGEWMDTERGRQRTGTRSWKTLPPLTLLYLPVVLRPPYRFCGTE